MRNAQCEFLRLFRGAFDQTPHQHLTQRRLAKAKELLATSDLSVTEVCFAVGFDSLGSFSALFRRYIGHAPSKTTSVGLPLTPYMPYNQLGCR